MAEAFALVGLCCAIQQLFNAIDDADIFQMQDLIDIVDIVQSKKDNPAIFTSDMDRLFRRCFQKKPTDQALAMRKASCYPPIEVELYKLAKALWMMKLLSKKFSLEDDLIGNDKPAKALAMIELAKTLAVIELPNKPVPSHDDRIGNDMRAKIAIAMKLAKALTTIEPSNKNFPSYGNMFGKSLEQFLGEVKIEVTSTSIFPRCGKEKHTYSSYKWLPEERILTVFTPKKSILRALCKNNSTREIMYGDHSFYIRNHINSLCNDFSIPLECRDQKYRQHKESLQSDFGNIFTQHSTIPIWREPRGNSPYENDSCEQFSWSRALWADQLVRYNQRNDVQDLIFVSHRSSTTVEERIRAIEPLSFSITKDIIGHLNSDCTKPISLQRSTSSSRVCSKIRTISFPSTSVFPVQRTAQQNNDDCFLQRPRNIYKRKKEPKDNITSSIQENSDSQDSGSGSLDDSDTSKEDSSVEDSGSSSSLLEHVLRSPDEQIISAKSRAIDRLMKEIFTNFQFRSKVVVCAGEGEIPPQRARPMPCQILRAQAKTSNQPDAFLGKGKKILLTKAMMMRMERGARSGVISGKSRS